MMRGRVVLAAAGSAAAILAVLLTGTATAQPPGPLQPLDGGEGFGVLVERDAYLAGREIQGTVAIGRDLTLGGTFAVATRTAGGFVARGDGVPTALVVGGRVDFAAGSPTGLLTVGGGGYAKVGDLTAAVVSVPNPGETLTGTQILATNVYGTMPRVELTVPQDPGSVGPSTPMEVARRFEAFRDRSASLASCPTTVTLRDDAGKPLARPIPDGTNARITLAEGRTNVLDISASELDSLAGLDFVNPPTRDSPLLINVDTADVEGDFSWHSPSFAGVGGDQARYVMINFPGAVNLAHEGGGDIEGTVFAPSATFTDDNPAAVEGAIVVRELRMSAGEVRDYPFVAQLSCGERAALPVARSADPSGTDPVLMPGMGTAPIVPTPTAAAGSGLMPGLSPVPIVPAPTAEAGSGFMPGTGPAPIASLPTSGAGSGLMPGVGPVPAAPALTAVAGSGLTSGLGPTPIVPALASGAGSGLPTASAGAGGGVVVRPSGAGSASPRASAGPGSPSGGRPPMPRSAGVLGMVPVTGMPVVLIAGGGLLLIVVGFLLLATTLRRE